MYGTDISTEMNNLLDADLVSKYGMKIVDVAIADINLTDESMKRVSKIDDALIFSDGKLQSGLMAEASAEALKNAASNDAGSMVGFMGMNMANSAGNTMMGAVNSNNNTSETSKEDRVMPEPGTLFAKKEDTPVETEEAKVEAKTEENIPSSYPKFCPNCGTPTSGGNFCGNCGKKLK